MTTELQARLLDETLVCCGADFIIRCEAAAEITRLTEEVERLEHANEMASNLEMARLEAMVDLGAKADALAEALKDARAEIISITESAVQRLVENGYECDPAERTYEVPVGKIDTALTAFQEGK